MRNECRADLRDAVGKRELELGDEELLDVRAANVLGLLDLDNAEDLHEGKTLQIFARYTLSTQERTWIDRKRARCLAAMSW